MRVGVRARAKCGRRRGAVRRAHLRDCAEGTAGQDLGGRREAGVGELVARRRRRDPHPRPCGNGLGQPREQKFIALMMESSMLYWWASEPLVIVRRGRARARARKGGRTCTRARGTLAHQCPRPACPARAVAAVFCSDRRKMVERGVRGSRGERAVGEIRGGPRPTPPARGPQCR